MTYKTVTSRIHNLILEFKKTFIGGIRDAIVYGAEPSCDLGQAQNNLLNYIRKTLKFNIS